jgi:hypothetical protein
MQLVDTAPAVDVQPEEYLRLLGYPRGWSLDGRAAELAAWARDWYGTHGRPWTFVRAAGPVSVVNAGVQIDGVRFSSPRLTSSLLRAGATSVALVAVSAGPEAEMEARRLWEAERPDEYFFLEIFASAVVEHLTTMTGARLCAWADGQQAAVLPHYSPGYPGWEIGEQAPLLDVLSRGAPGGLPGPLEALPSGALNPKKSLLAVFGITPHAEAVQRLTDLVPCENCSFGPCQYRRARYKRAAAAPDELRNDTFQGTPFSGRAGARAAVPPPAYSVHARALRRWAGERLSLDTSVDGTTVAIFRYDGTTCTNMGHPLVFDYQVTLGPRTEGYPILSQQCAPASGDTGHALMCGYLREGEALMRTIRQERPLVGRPLADVLTWERARSGAGCYCEPAGREHKWGLALETIHYALTQRDAGDHEGDRER